TDGTGFYQFNNLPEGTYRVVVDDDDADLPDGVTFTPGASGTVSGLSVTIGAPVAQAHFPFLLPPALTVDKDNDDDNGYVEPGQSVTFSVTVTNVGASPAYSIVITDTLPADWTFDTSVDA